MKNFTPFLITLISIIGITTVSAQQNEPLKSVAAFSMQPNAVQPSYNPTPSESGTNNTPFLKIVSGTNKTSYVSAVLNDVTDPISIEGISFSLEGTGHTYTVTSSKTSVVKISDVIITNISSTEIKVTIKPSAVGYTDIKITAVNSASTSNYHIIKLAVSASSANPQNTTFQTGMADASAAVPYKGDDLMFVCDDETNILRLYSRKHSGKQIYAYDFTSAVGASEECDVEGASAGVKYPNNIYWIGSLGNSKSGNLKPNRDRVITTQINGATKLSCSSYSAKMRSALITWGDNNGWKFTTSSASGMIPKRIDGFNVEGLTVTHAGESAYIGFRAPCVPAKGVTPTTSNRIYAILAPVTNFETMMNGAGTISTTPTMGEPILFDFEGLGIRSIERVGTSEYIIVAGLYTGGGSPAVYLWDGVVPANSAPITVTSSASKLIKLNLSGLSDLAQISSDGVAEGHPEGMVASKSGNSYKIELLSDNGTVDYYGDGTEAKALANAEFKKFRTDVFMYDAIPNEIAPEYLSNIDYWMDNGAVTLKNLLLGGNILVTDVSGRVVYTTKITQNETTIHLKQGIYIVQVMGEEKQILKLFVD